LEVSPDDPAATAPANAVNPAEDFVASSTRAGKIFDDVVISGEERLEVRVTRQDDAVVAETRRMPKQRGADEPEPGWRVSVRLAVPSTAQLRAAAFSKKRYASAPLASQ
jgi:hypothetical protein